MHTMAALLIDLNHPLEIEKIEIPPLRAGQVLVKIHYSGVCHTQILEIEGHRGEDPFLPHCMGHEGSGEVIETGKEVKKIKIGDRVILSWIKGNGQNVPSAQYKWRDKVVNSGAVATFNQYAVISENRITLLQENEDRFMKEAALIGCAVPTGLGSILNVSRPKANQSLGVFGCGGIGLWAIQGAKLSNCNPIFAIDIFDNKLELAKKMGATVLINAAKEDPIKRIMEYGPLDYAIEATGSERVMQQTLDVVKPQGGKAVIIGNASHGSFMQIDPKEFNMGKSILGSWGGGSNPDLDYFKYFDLMKLKKIDSSEFTNKIYSLSEINDAISDLKQGRVLRPIIGMLAE